MCLATAGAGELELPLIVGGLSLAVGAMLLLAGRRTRGSGNSALAVLVLTATVATGLFASTAVRAEAAPVGCPSAPVPATGPVASVSTARSTPAPTVRTTPTSTDPTSTDPTSASPTAASPSVPSSSTSRPGGND